MLLRDRHYLGLVFIGTFAMAGFFTYLANPSFVLIDHYGLTPVLLQRRLRRATPRLVLRRRAVQRARWASASASVRVVKGAASAPAAR